MKVMKRTILSLGVVAALAANTYGAGQVWYSAVAGNANSSVITQCAAGGQTQLGCTTGPGQLTITVHYTLADGGAAGWALDHYGNTADASAAGLSVTSAGFTSGVTNGTVDNAGGIL